LEGEGKLNAPAESPGRAATPPDGRGEPLLAELMAWGDLMAMANTPGDKLCNDVASILLLFRLSLEIIAYFSSIREGVAQIFSI
jgi:hypothetical protein